METFNYNEELREIGAKLREAKSVLLFPHIQMDGDALGSAAALCRGLRNAGKDAWILTEDEIPKYIHFLDEGYCTADQKKIAEPDVCMCIDCGEVSRFPKREKAFFRGKTTICLDHHATSEPFADFNCIDGKSAAAAELVYRLLKQMDLAPDREMAEALYTAISSDTGHFRYSNTTADTLRIAADLCDAGIDAAGIAVKLYQNVPLSKLKITNRILDTMEIFAEGKAAMAFVNAEMLEENGARLEDAEGVVDTLRDIQGVEIAAFVKEKEPNKVKVSMRAKTGADVAQIACRFKGGGHVKAAGCTIEASLSEALVILKKEIEQSLEQ